MSNIRNLKKEIKNLSAELIAECETYISFHPETDRKKANKIIASITEKEKSLMYEISHLKNSANIAPKAYYSKITEKVKKEMLPLLDEIGELAGK